MRHRTAGLALVVVVLVAVVVAVNNIRVNTLERRAERDVATAARASGLQDVTAVRFRYPFWVENAGLASRNVEPFPYGYGFLNLVLDGCLLRDVAVSATPDTRSWWPRPVDVRHLRFQYEHTGTSVGGAPPPFLRIEFNTADELRTGLRRAFGGGGCPSD